MKSTFIAFAMVALCSAEISVTYAAVLGPDTAGLSDEAFTTPADFLYNPGFEGFTSAPDNLSQDARLVISLGTGAAGVAHSAVVIGDGNDTMPAYLASSGDPTSVPLPEPSSQTALYVLSGAVGLGCVVLRRRRALV